MAFAKEKAKDQVTDTHSYRGWLNSDSFMKRAFACLGYQSVAALIIYGIILGAVFVFFIIFAIIAGIAGILS